MNPLSILRQFFKGLTKENMPWQIGLGIAFGFALGIIPKNNLTAQIIFIAMMSTKANIPFAFVSTAFFSGLYFFTDKITDPLGYAVLNSEKLYPFFVKIYNMPIIPWTDFNNTTVLGGIILGLIFFFPVYLAGKKIGEFYNAKMKDKISNSKIVKAMKTSWAFEWYFRD